MSLFLSNVYKYVIIITTINNGNNIYSNIGIYGTQKYTFTKTTNRNIYRYRYVRNTYVDVDYGQKLREK